MATAIDSGYRISDFIPTVIILKKYGVTTVIELFPNLFK